MYLLKNSKFENTQQRSYVILAFFSVTLIVINTINFFSGLFLTSGSISYLETQIFLIVSIFGFFAFRTFKTSFSKNVKQSKYEEIVVNTAPRRRKEKKRGRGRINKIKDTSGGPKFKKTLEKQEILDIFFFITVALFAFTAVYQVTFIGSQVNEIRELGVTALGLGVMGAMAFGLTFALMASGYIEIKNFREEYNASGRDFNFSLIKADETFKDDFLNIFLIALVAQIGFSFVYGGFTGSVFELTFNWNLNAIMQVINTAVAEELFFNLFLTAFLLSVLPKERYSIFLAGAINIFGFLAFHLVVYGTNPEASYFIFGLRLIYFLVYYKTRRASIPILLHVLNNFLFVSTLLFI